MVSTVMTITHDDITPEEWSIIEEIWTIQAEQEALIQRSVDSNIADAILDQTDVFAPSDYGQVGTQLMLV